MVNITKRYVESLEPKEKDFIAWDDAIKGFGIKVTPKGKRVYLFKYRNLGNVQRKKMLGQHGAISCEQARAMAKDFTYDVSHGKDPSGEKRAIKSSPSLSESCDRYLSEYAAVFKKASSMELDKIYIEKHIKPVIGKLKIASIGQKEIAEFHASLHYIAPQANRILNLLSKIFNLAETWGVRANNTNPVKGIKKYPEKVRERFLASEEVKRLLTVLDEMEEEGVESVYMIALVRLLVFTGARLREIMHAKWEWVDLEKGILRLPDSKTGRRTIQLPIPAVEVLRNLPRVEGNAFIIVGTVAGQHMINARKPWLRIRQRAELEDVRMHDLRHSFAALCIEAGIPLYHVGKLLGHTQARTTERYAHLAEDPIKEAAELVGSKFNMLKE